MNEELKSFLAALSSNIEPLIVKTVESAVAARLPAASPLFNSLVSAGEAAFAKKNPTYFPGIDNAASSPPSGPSPDLKAPIQSVDVTVSPLAVGLNDDAQPHDIVAYVVALNAKVDALIESTGHGSSAAMADHG